MTRAGSTQGASRVGALAVVVSAGASPFLAQTLSAITSQTCAPDVVLVVDVASRANGLGDGTPIEELVESSGLGKATAVRVVRVKEAKSFGDAVSRGLTAYAELVAAGNRKRRSSEVVDGAEGSDADTTSSGPRTSVRDLLLSGSGPITGPTGALSPITAYEQRLVAPTEAAPEMPEHQVWFWLLHDDSAPAEDCLERLLTAATNARSVGVVGPKQVGWDNPELLLEVGLRATASARRANDIVPGEVDQGQHDDRSDVLAVGTAGALIDRAVWEEIGGIAPWLGPFGDGLELSRAARLAGYRVIVEPTAVIRHRRASYQGLRRPASVSHSSDDGEPSGTAGRPMLDVLAGTGIVDVVAVVTRYFGGTLLGTGGLVRAYSDAVRECLEDALLVTRERLPVWNALLPHADAGRYLAELSAAGFAAEPDYRAEGVRVTVVCDEGERLSSLVSRLSSGSVGVLEGGTRLVERPAGRVRAGRAVIG